MKGHAVVLVGVPALEEWVRSRTAHYDPAFVSADAAFAHAHVTVLAPFPLDRAGALAAVAGAVEPFRYRLERLAVFPDGVIHLVPEPDAPFRELTRRARLAAPEVEPYWGRVSDPQPHLTLDRVSDAVGVASTRASLGARLPASGVADRLLLTWWEAGHCRVLDAWPLGGHPRGGPVHRAA